MRTNRLVAAALLFAFVAPAPLQAAEVPGGVFTLPSQGVTARRPFDAASLGRAVEAERRLQAAQAASPAAPKRDSVWNGAWIGAAVGAIAGGVSAVTTGSSCSSPDYGGGCSTVGAASAGPAFVAGALVGGLLGAGIGAIVDSLIK